MNTLNGFWNYVQSLKVEPFSKYPNYVFFGEWLCSHTIKYKQEAYNQFYFYDVFDKETNGYLTQDKVKELADELGLQYVKVLYDGEFISWEHCKSFAGISDIATQKGEGCVIKNQTNINSENTLEPFVLKFVVEEFAEIKAHNHEIKQKELNIDEQRTMEIVEQIVTFNRVRKELLKMIDENILPQKLDETNMSVIAKLLPKRIYDDCVKEEKDLVDEAGQKFGRLCSKQSMKFVRQIVLNI